jgi:hypothetical protein
MVYDGRTFSSRGNEKGVTVDRWALLALPLLVLRVLADDHHAALAANDLALFAHGLDGRSNFHCGSLLMLFPRLADCPLFERLLYDMHCLHAAAAYLRSGLAAPGDSTLG